VTFVSLFDDFTRAYHIAVAVVVIGGYRVYAATKSGSR